MKWLKPTDEHIVYEALSAVADNRIELINQTTARCSSSSKGKYYIINYDSASKSIMSNDNMAYYKSEVSYPMLAMLMLLGETQYSKELLPYFVDIKWKDINQRNKNNYMKSVEEVLADLESRSVNIQWIKEEVSNIFNKLIAFELNMLGDKVMPPKAY